MNEPLNPIQTAADLTPEPNPPKPATMTNETTETSTENGAIHHENAHETVDDFALLDNTNDAKAPTGEPLPASKKPQQKTVIAPFYDVNPDTKELFYFGVTKDKSGWLEPLRLCNALKVVGHGYDEGGEHYRLIEFENAAIGGLDVVELKAAVIGEREGTARLNGRGLAISNSRTARELLADYLQTGGSSAQYKLATTGGWHGDVYVLPSGELLGESARPMRYIGDRSNAKAYGHKGSVESWRESVGRLAKGNSRAMFAIGCALAAPLLHWVDGESGGFHFYGDSGDGKTTCALVGGSVWGGPEHQKQSWNATGVGLSGEAAAINDGLLILDEIGQATPDTVYRVIYDLFNGVDKARGAKDGGNRVKARWRIMALSTGEHRIIHYLAGGGKKINGGQAARLIDVKSDAGANMGAWECLHECESAGDLAETIKAAALRNHGTLGREFIALLAGDIEAAKSMVRELAADWLAMLPDDSAGQARRATLRFALVAAALEMATQHGLTGWAENDGLLAVKGMYSDWLNLNGTGKHEDKAIAERAEKVLSARLYDVFLNGDDPKIKEGETKPIDPTIRELAGYRLTAKNNELLLYVLRWFFDDVICAGHDPERCKAVFADLGMLKSVKPEQKRFGMTKYYYYVFLRYTAAADDNKENAT